MQTDFNYRKDLLERIDIGRTLGTGQYGTVRLAVDKESGVEYALKSVPKVKWVT